ncbi:MAG: hypothetical protein HUN04_23405 [Desulfobacter sp.]|nr:MAG: hypothetical protein HUN04_23405 [Desulfobacter sp.]
MKKNKIAELLVFTLGLLVLNSHLLYGSAENPLVYHPGRSGIMGAAALVLHPFVHVSLYHFVLDAGAFLLLWFGLRASFARRSAYLALSGLFSFIFVTKLAPAAAAPGFCGLSGIGHGLMAVLCLEMAREKSLQGLALLSLAAVAAKSVYEVGSGNVLFSAMHMGMCGNPVPASHAGGLLGGMAGFALFNFRGFKIGSLDWFDLRFGPKA